MVEFAFCMIILFLMMYGVVMVFRWVGLDLGQRQQAHEDLLTTDIDASYGSGSVPVERGPLTQIDPYFYQPESMNSVWTGN